MYGKLMALISIMSDFCLKAPCSSHSSRLSLNNLDSTDALESCVSLAIHSKHRKLVSQGHTGLI